MFLLSPFLIFLTVFIVLKDNKLPYPELGCDEEWGYADKVKSELGMF